MLPQDPADKTEAPVPEGEGESPAAEDASGNEKIKQEEDALEIAFAQEVGELETDEEEIDEEEISTLELDDILKNTKIRLEQDSAGITTITNLDTNEEIVKERGFWFSWYAFHPDTTIFIP